MARYRYHGNPAIVPDLMGGSWGSRENLMHPEREENVLYPGDEIETDVEINNVYFERLEDPKPSRQPKPEPEEAAEPTEAPEA